MAATYVRVPNFNYPRSEFGEPTTVRGCFEQWGEMGKDLCEELVRQ